MPKAFTKTMRGTIIGLACLLICGIFCEAQAETRTVTGFGISYKDAVMNGLIEAIQQVKGVRVDAVNQVRTSFAELMTATNGVDNDYLVLTEEQTSDILSKTKGAISSYEILEVTRSQSRVGYEAHLRVEIPVYQSPGLSPDNRRKLVVLPFRSSSNYFTFEGLDISATDAIRQMNQALVTAFSQSRRFTVLDREFIDEFLTEKQIITSPDAPIQEQAKLGNVLGVDYMVVGTINETGSEYFENVSQLTGQVSHGWTAHVSIDYRIILMATRQVKWANSVRIELGSGEMNTLSANATADQIRDALFDKAAANIANEALGNIYPIQVVSSLGSGEYVLNQGGSGLTIGDRFDVFTPGKAIIDPYTKESLGKTEEWAGAVEVTRVTAKMSYAHLVDGNPTRIKDQAICRRQATSFDSQDYRQKIEQNATGIIQGVRLPFD